MQLLFQIVKDPEKYARHREPVLRLVWRSPK